MNKHIETRVRLIEQCVASLCANIGLDPVPYSTASGAVLWKTFDENHQSGLQWRCLCFKV